MQSTSQPFGSRTWIAIGVTAAAGIYTLGVITGWIPEQRRIDAANLAIIVLASSCAILLFFPQLLGRMKSLELAGFRIELQTQINQVQQTVTAQEQQINILLQTAMSRKIFQHLVGIACLKNYEYHDQWLFQREIYYLKDHGYIRMKDEYERQEFDSGFDGENIVDVTTVTEAGWSIIRLRKHDIEQWVKGSGDRINRSIPSDILAALESR